MVKQPHAGGPGYGGQAGLLTSPKMDTFPTRLPRALAVILILVAIGMVVVNTVFLVLEPWSEFQISHGFWGSIGYLVAGPVVLYAASKKTPGSVTAAAIVCVVAVICLGIPQVAISADCLSDITEELHDARDELYQQGCRGYGPSRPDYPPTGPTRGPNYPTTRPSQGPNYPTTRPSLNPYSTTIPYRTTAYIISNNKGKPLKSNGLGNMDYDRSDGYGGGGQYHGGRCDYLQTQMDRIERLVAGHASMLALSLVAIILCTVCGVIAGKSACASRKLFATPPPSRPPTSYTNQAVENPYNTNRPPNYDNISTSNMHVIETSPHQEYSLGNNMQTSMVHSGAANGVTFTPPPYDAEPTKQPLY